MKATVQWVRVADVGGCAVSSSSKWGSPPPPNLHVQWPWTECEAGGFKKGSMVRSRVMCCVSWQTSVVIEQSVIINVGRVEH